MNRDEPVAPRSCRNYFNSWMLIWRHPGGTSLVWTSRFILADGHPISTHFHNAECAFRHPEIV